MASDTVEPVAAIILMAALGAVLGLMAAGLAASRSAFVQDALDETNARLRTSEERSRTILDQLPDLVLTKDRNGGITWVNAAVEHMFDLSRSSLVGAPMAGLFAGSAAETLAGLELVVIEQRQAANGSVVLGSEAGAEVWMDVRILPVVAEGDEVTGVLEVLTDVTSAHEAQRAQERLAAVVEASQDAIFTLDVDGIVTSWNPAAERVLGWSFDELVGTDARSIMRGDDAATPVWGADVGPAGISGRHARWLTKAGQPISLRVSASPLGIPTEAGPVRRSWPAM